MPRVGPLLVVLAFAMVAPAAGAGEQGTREQAVQMVRRVQEMFDRAGPEPTFRAINARSPEFYDGDRYVFISDLNGVTVAHGDRPVLVGKNLISLKDQDGRFLIREMIAIARGPGSGWIDYKWPNPRTKKMAEKSSYIERMGDYFVGVGIYKQ